MTASISASAQARVDPGFWHGKRVLLTGHTGFKGSWLALWLQSMGARVKGIALDPPTTPSLFVEAGVAHGMESSNIDIRDGQAVLGTMQDFCPDIVLHLAAQALVRTSYAQPADTYATNVMGTVHVLDAARQVASVRAIVNVTTDKCYENKEWVWGYREDDPMGGHDPYSSSKGCAELVTSAFRRSFFAERKIALASARAGNVIGGGDWALDRLVPDTLKAFQAGRPVLVRNPSAVRPWQHVLEPLSGYLTLAQHLITDGQSVAEAWNFGPREADCRPVRWIVDTLARQWGHDALWSGGEGTHPHEAHHLKLDISKAGARLGWHPRWPLETALARVVDWHRSWLERADMRSVCLGQIEQYNAALNEEIA